MLVLAGPGNNGGDGYVAARLLAAGRLAGAPRRAGPAAPRLRRRRRRPPMVRPHRPVHPDEAARADIVIDAVFGAGLTRPVTGLVADTLKAARRVVAVDVPSGLDGATGLPLGYAPAAELTVTFFRLKPGHLLLPGRDLCGRIELADIGIPDTRPGRHRAANTFANLPTLWRLPALTTESHKYTRGHVTVVGGATMTGAARLAAEAARRAGAGMVTIAARGAAETYRSGEPGLLVSEAGHRRRCCRTIAAKSGSAAPAWVRTRPARCLPRPDRREPDRGRRRRRVLRFRRRPGRAARAPPS